MSNRNETAEYSLYIFHETDRAYLVGTDVRHMDTDEAFWLPKSQVESPSTLMKDGVEWATFTIPNWLADEKGLDAGLDSNDDFSDFF